MKPIKLKIKGLNSFVEEQEIDFESLSKNGLFGIFGPTGSGKSTVIDAITMALYGEMSRYDGERGNRQFINALSDAMWVYFEFAIFEEGQEVRYVVERSYKRSGATQKITLARLYTLGDDGIRILQDKPAKINQAIEDLIGLGYKDFSRSVILPQGKFSQFLHLANLERRSMLERIFGLEKYGDTIGGIVRSELSAVKQDLDTIRNKLELFGEITPAALEEDYRTLKNFQAQLAFKNSALARQEGWMEEIRLTAAAYEEYCAAAETDRRLQEEKSHIEEKRERQRRGENAAYILPSYEEYQKTEKLLTQTQQSLTAFLPAVDKLSAEEKEATDALNALRRQKDQRLPLLLERELHLKSVLRLTEESAVLSRETAQLRAQYKALKKEADEKAAAIKACGNKQKELEQQINEVAVKKKEFFVSSEERAVVEQGNTLTKALESHKETRQKTAERLKELQNHLVVNQKAFDAAAQALDHGLKDKTLIESNLENLRRTDMPKQDSIIQLREQIVHKESAYTALTEKYRQYTILKKELAAAREQLSEARAFQESNLKEEAAAKETLDNAEQSLAAYEQADMAAAIAKVLADGVPCPVCGSLEHPSPARNMSEALLSELTAARDTARKQWTAAAEKVTVGQRRVDLLQENIARLENNLGDAGEDVVHFSPEKALAEIGALKKEAAERETAFTRWQENLAAQDKALSELEKRLSGLTAEKQGLAASLQKDKKTEALWLAELEGADRQIEAEEARLQELSQSCKVNDFSSAYEKLALHTSRYQDMEKEEEDLRRTWENAAKEATALNAAYTGEIGNLEAIKTSGLEKAQVLKEKQEEIQRLSQGESPAQALIAVQADIQGIHQGEQSAAGRAVKASEAFQKATLQMESLGEKQRTYQKVLEDQEKNLAGLLERYGFTHMEDMAKAACTGEELASLRTQIKRHDALVAQVAVQLSALKEKLKDKDGPQAREQYQTIQETIAGLKDEILDLSKKTAVFEENINIKKANLEKIQKLKAEEAVRNRRLDLLEDLSKLFEGKKFVEYVAKRHLSYITRDASARLKDMSGGRFAFELDGADFVIRDDGNGGLRRGPKTLSGGETFMASLCLALALSAKVQLKSRSSLEFFFLDEGFGSLDSEVLTAVMNSLINLQSHNIKVGIISHVEELKNQMPAKLTVSPPGYAGEGSRIAIE